MRDLFKFLEGEAGRFADWDLELAVDPPRIGPARQRRRHGDHQADDDHQANVDAQRLGHCQGPGCRRHEDVRRHSARANRERVEQVVPAPGAHAHRAGQGNEQVENRVMEDRNRQDIAADHHRERGVLLPQPRHEATSDLLRSTALHQALPDHSGHGNRHTDPADQPTEGFGDRPHDVLDRHVGREQPDQDGGKDEGGEGVNFPADDQQEDRRHRNQQNQNRVHEFRTEYNGLVS